MSHPLSVRAAALALASALFSPLLSAQSTPARPQPYALKGVRLSVEEDAHERTLILRDGRITDIVDAAASLPSGLLEIDGSGLVAVPAFLDAFSAEGCETPEPVAEQDTPAPVNANVHIDMREANRKGIQPSFRAVDAFALEDGDLEKYREQGFGAFLSAPRGQLFGGQSALAATRDAAVRDAIVDGEVFHHAAFAASGRGYPTTLMGYHAQVRQFLMDARHQAELERRFEEGRPGRRPPWDADLAEGVAILDGGGRLVCEADTHRDVERWIRLADEFGLKIAIAGGRDAWKVADLLVERQIPVLHTLDWDEEVDDPDAEEEEEEEEKEEGKEGEEEEEAEEPDAEEEEESDAEAEDEKDWAYEEPLAVQRERRRLWEEQRDSALRLHEAGVKLAFGCAGKPPKKLLKRVRTIVEHGFPADAAVQALTRTPAELLGVERDLGRLEPGATASIALWTEHPTAEKAKLAWLVVDGFPYEFDVEVEEEREAPVEDIDLSGTWLLEVDSERMEEMTFELSMSDDGDLSGTSTFETRFSEEPITRDVEGYLSAKDIRLEMTLEFGEMTMEFVFRGQVDDADSFHGEVTAGTPGGNQKMDFSARRNPDQN